MKKRMISVLLVLCMLLAMFPATAFADGIKDDSVKVENPFADVSQSDWFYDGVMHALSSGLFAGVSADRFDPQGTMTRAMYVTVMGRMAEIDTTAYAGKTVFQDVDPASWCGPYVAWAQRQGITNGVGGERFDPNGLITREQMAAMTVRFFSANQIAYPPNTVSTEPLDANSISAYARRAVSKLWKCGLFQGDSAGNFNPNANASRAEAATFCVRVDQAVEQWFIETGKKEAPPKKEAPGKESGAGGGSSSGGGVSYTYYQITFDSNGGSKVNNFSRREGSNLSNLPVPYQANHIFHGWCYDQALEHLVSSSDTLRENITLYAKWGETQPLPEDETPAFARAINTTADFTIEITAPDGWTAEQVMSAITMKNLSSNEEKTWIAVEAGDNGFVVSGVNYKGENGAQQPGFIAGANYKLTLEDDALTFVGQSAATRTYDFTIQKEEVMNVSLNADIIYINTSKLSNLVVNGKPATEISVAVITIGQDGSTTQNGAQTVGSFTYTEKPLAVGDSVAIYQGDKIPDMNSSAAGDEMSFVTITAVDGQKFSYQGSAMEDVLFMPDVLPVPKDADTDGNGSDSSITVPVETMTYTDDKYTNLGLTSQTTVDEGDFISFYGGTLEESGAGATAAGYARIDKVEESDGNYIIRYTAVEQEEMMEAMSAYRKEQMEGEDLLEGVDTEDIERSVEQQARDSGFANEAGMYLAAMALETDSFTEISEDFDLSEYSVTMPEGMSRSGLVQMRGNKVEVDVTTLQATISTKLIHFEDLSGLRLTLTVGVEVTIHAPAGDIKIEISGSFEQEVKIDLGVDGNAVWKWWFIFPYIAEYEVTAWVDLYTFTGIGIEATITTNAADDGEGMGTGDETFEDIGQQIKDLLDEKDKYLGDGEDSVVSTLEEKYAEMLENESDWVELFEKTIFEQHFRIILIIDVEIKISFVVSANLNISLGLDFWYENAKRYMYTVAIFSGTVRNDTIDLVTEHYEFEFYVMGTMGLRAGVRASIAVGLFTTKFASVGFTAEAGVYVRVWGYFYYQLIFDAKANPQKTTYYAGALLFELGIYLEITFEAQAFNGTFSYNPTLLDKEWPLWSAGMRENIRSFAYGEEDTPELKLKKSIQTTILPDDLFEMDYMDLKTGDIESKIYDDSTKYFSIAMTNNKFSYDRTTNRLTVSPGAGDFNLDGEMILTWVNQPLAFSSTAIQRRISLHWDNLNNGYAIVFHGGGGSSIPVLIARYGEAIKAPQDPVKKGYAFAGWYQDEELTQPYTIPETMPNADVELYAKWAPATDTPYKVEHYGEVLGRIQYDLLDTEILQGGTDGEGTAPTRTYPGHTAPEAKSVKILPDGSSVLRYYYDLTAYTLTFDPGVAQGEQSVTTLKYGAVITAPVFSSKGYTFTGWNAEVASRMPAEDLTYTAQWKAGANTPYRVEYYVEQPDGRFALQRLVEKTGETGGAVDISTLLDESYLVPGGITYLNVTAGGEETTQPKITEDGKLIIKVNYARDTHDATYDFGYDGPDDRVDTYRYGARITRPENPVRAGYTFMGWDAGIPETMGTEDLQFTAQWSANENTPYKVEHYQQNAADDGYTLFETENLTGTTDTTATAEDQSYEYFALTEPADGNIAGDGSLVLRLYYDRDTFTVDYTVEGEAYAEPQTYKHGQKVDYPAEPELEGYNFGGWAFYGGDFGGVMPTESITLTAKWLALTDYPYTVNYYQEGLNGADNILVRSETPIGTFNSPVTVTPTDDYTGFTAPAEQTATIAQGLVVDHIYTRNRYLLTWDLGGGTATNDYTPDGDVAFETPLVEPVLTKEGYTYVWDGVIPAKMGTEELSYTALWTANRYTLKFDANGGTGDMASMDFIYDEPQVLTVGTYARTGYTFDGWARTAAATRADYADGESVHNLTAAEDGTVTLYAVWSPISYDISYVLNGGTNSGDNPPEYTITDNISLAEPTRDGYTFEGWYLNAELTQKAETLAIQAGSTESKTFYAQWTANTYTVTFHKNAGDGATASQSFTYDAAEQPLTTNTFTHEGYNFSGWNTQADGKGTAYTDGQAVRNLTTGSLFPLYAQWTPSSYKIEYVLSGGTNDLGNPASHNPATELTLLDPTRDGFTFMGWYEGEEKVTVIPQGNIVDKVLTAKWGHPGIFTVSHYWNYSTNSGEFRIKREGVAGADMPYMGEQTIYFRTVNGTAINGTHFTTKAMVMTFGDGDDGDWGEKTIEITETLDAPYKNSTIGKTYNATAYTNIPRTYGVELLSIQGGGTFGDTTKAMKTYAYGKVPEQTLPGDFYTEFGITMLLAPITLTSGSGSHFIESKSIKRTDAASRDRTYDATRSYWEETADRIEATVTANVNVSGGSASFQIEDYRFPNTAKKSTSLSKGTNTPALSDIFDLATTGVVARYTVSGGAKLTAQAPKYQFKIIDETEPTQIGVAPMADGNYKAGETVTISVVFNEIVAKADGVTITGDNLTGAWTCTGGIGSNVLTFTGPLARDCTAEEVVAGVKVIGDVFDMAN